MVQIHEIPDHVSGTRSEGAGYGANECEVEEVPGTSRVSGCSACYCGRELLHDGYSWLYEVLGYNWNGDTFAKKVRKLMHLARMVMCWKALQSGGCRSLMEWGL